MQEPEAKIEENLEEESLNRIRTEKALEGLQRLQNKLDRRSKKNIRRRTRILTDINRIRKSLSIRQLQLEEF